jgi:hypothetical protein
MAFAAAPPDPDDPLLGFTPYAHKQPRRNAITPDRQRAFIAALAASGIVTQAAREIGASLEALYKLRHRSGAEGFAAAWEAAIDRGVARLEDCALERAIAGEERIVVRGGEVVATWRRYDTPLLLFLLRQRRARRFNEGSAHFVNLKPGHPVYERLQREWRAASDAEEPSEQETLDSIDALFRDMRERRAANAAILAADDDEALEWEQDD